MNPLDALANNTQQVNDSLIRNFEAMPEDKRTWRPLEAGRTALDQIQECAIINDWAADILLTGAVPERDWEAATKAMDTSAKALDSLRASTTKLAEATRTLKPDRFQDPIVLPWSPEPTTLFECTLIGYWNSTYHLGQISYIQTLYGDRDFH